LRRSGVSRLLHQDFSSSLRDFLQDRCAASDVIAVEERSGVHFVPSNPSEVPWTSRELQRFFSFIDYLKDRFAIVMIDLPPVLGLSETIRLAAVADSVALIIRWGRTERQFVQFALDALRSAGVSARTVILNDVDLKAQQRRGYRDRSAVYAYDGLYRSKSGDRHAAAPAQLVPLGRSKENSRPFREPEEPPREAYRDHVRDPVDPSTTTATLAQSDIQRLYDRYRG
jgi:Mrp family chromosome partitioning ATPase